MLSRAVHAFEKQFVRLMEEVSRLYPNETQLRLWLAALMVKLAVAPEQTRRDMCHHFYNYVSQPLGGWIETRNEAAILEFTQSKGTVDLDANQAQWFSHFYQLYEQEQCLENKDAMWQYVQSLHMLCNLAHESS